MDDDTRAAGFYWIMVPSDTEEGWVPAWWQAPDFEEDEDSFGIWYPCGMTDGLVSLVVVGPRIEPPRLS